MAKTDTIIQLDEIRKTYGAGQEGDWTIARTIY